MISGPNRRRSSLPHPQPTSRRTPRPGIRFYRLSLSKQPPNPRRRRKPRRRRELTPTPARSGSRPAACACRRSISRSRIRRPHGPEAARTRPNRSTSARASRSATWRSASQAEGSRRNKAPQAAPARAEGPRQDCKAAPPRPSAYAGHTLLRRADAPAADEISHHGASRRPKRRCRSSTARRRSAR